MTEKLIEPLLTSSDTLLYSIIQGYKLFGYVFQIIEAWQFTRALALYLLLKINLKQRNGSEWNQITNSWYVCYCIETKGIEDKIILYSVLYCLLKHYYYYVYEKCFSIVCRCDCAKETKISL